MQFLKDFEPWINQLLKERKEVIVLGDYNVVHLDKDIHNPQRKDNPSGFRPEERAWMDAWFDSNFKDAFRLVNLLSVFRGNHDPVGTVSSFQKNLGNATGPTIRNSGTGGTGRSNREIRSPPKTGRD